MNTKKIKKQLTVAASYPLSTNMQRLEFTTDDMQYFSKDSAGQYVKLMFTPTGETDLELLNADEPPVLRTYTLREIDVLNKRLTIDFVKHVGGVSNTSNYAVADLRVTAHSGGHGHYFAERAQVGDVIYILGPGTLQSIDLNTDWVLLVADMTAIPALSVVLEDLSADAQGYVVLEVTSNADIPALTLPPKVVLTVCVRGQAASLAETVKQLSWLDGQPSVWCACEFSDMKAIRSYITHAHEVERAGCYFSSYWKEGVTEDGHKIFKQQDNEALKA